MWILLDKAVGFKIIKLVKSLAMLPTISSYVMIC